MPAPPEHSLILPPEPQPPARDPEQFEPVFVLAAARSYSSVVTAMVGRNPGLAGLPELKLFRYPTIGELAESLPAAWRERGVTHRSPGLVRAVAQFCFGGQSAESVAGAQAWLRDRGHWPGADVLDALLARIQPRAAVEKSPENVATPVALRRLTAAYPRARYLHLTRHPASALHSMREHWRRRMPGQTVADLDSCCAASWLDINERISRFGATLSADRYLRLRAEDVLNQPVAQLRLVARWLGVPADDDAVAAMRHPEQSPFACPGPSGTGVEGGSDPGFLASPAPRPAVLPETLDQPAGWMLDPALWSMAAEMAAQFGYNQKGARRPVASR
jgi:Sulfotransferase family